MLSDQIRKEMYKFMRRAIIEAKKAALNVENQPVSDDLAYLRRETAASAHASQALSYALAAESLYIAASDAPCEYYEFECVAHQLKAFAAELTANIERHKSHAWSLVEFDKLMQEVKGTEYEFEL